MGKLLFVAILAAAALFAGSSVGASQTNAADTPRNLTYLADGSTVECDVREAIIDSEALIFFGEPDEPRASTVHEVVLKELAIYPGLAAPSVSATVANARLRVPAGAGPVDAAGSVLELQDDEVPLDREEPYSVDLDLVLGENGDRVGALRVVRAPTGWNVQRLVACESALFGTMSADELGKLQREREEAKS